VTFPFYIGGINLAKELYFCSNANAMDRIVPSSYGLPTIWMPSGILNLSKPTGILTAGNCNIKWNIVSQESTTNLG
jgi:hypothetical protein